MASASNPICAIVAPAAYKPRRPEKTVLYQTAVAHLESWLAARREALPDDVPIPAFVEKAFREYLQCGIFCFGFCRVRCLRCGHEFPTAFSCKGRGVCPSCAQRYMVATAAGLVDNVLPRVPYRQWVLALPKRIRYFALHDSERADAIIGILLRAVEREVKRATPSAPPSARIGAVAFPLRFGSAINAHWHIHVIATDGTFSADPNGIIAFHEATALDEASARRVAEKIRPRILRHLVHHGCIEADDAKAMLQWQHGGGFSVDASVRIEHYDRHGLERLVRYCARPAFSNERLNRLDEQNLIYYQLPAADQSGRTAITLSPFELFDRLAQLIVPPRIHRHHYYGCLASNHPLRPFVILSSGPLPAAEDKDKEPAPANPACPPPKPARRNLLWAALIARIYGPLLCPKCGSDQVKIVAFITEADTIARILTHLGEPTKPPPILPARAPPQQWFDFQQPGPDF